MRLWPWSELRRLEQENLRLRQTLDVLWHRGREHLDETGHPCWSVSLGFDHSLNDCALRAEMLRAVDSLTEELRRLPWCDGKR